MTNRYMSSFNVVMMTLMSSIAYMSVANVIHLKDFDQYKEVSSRRKPYVLKFHMNGCGLCKIAAPVYEQAAKKYTGILFLEIERSNTHSLGIQKDIDVTVGGFPTFVFFDAQGKKVAKMTGFSAEEFHKYLNELLVNHMPTQQAAPKKQKNPQHHQETPHHDTHHKGRGHHKKAYHTDVHAKKQVAPAAPMTIKKQSCPVTQQTTTQTVSAQQESLGKLIHLNSVTQLDELKKAYPKLVLIFSTSWCGPCKQMKPVYEQMAAQYASVPFVYVDGDTAVAPELKQSYGVNSYPHVVFINNKDVKLGELPGACDASVVHGAFSAHLGR